MDATESFNDQPRSFTGTGRPVSRRIGSPEAAYLLISKLKDSVFNMALSDARVMGMYNGQPPWKDSDLTRLGQAWRANFNTRELKAAINGKADAAYELHLETETRIDVQVNNAFRNTTSETPFEEWGMVIAEEYTEMHDRWASGYKQIDTATRESLKYGLGGMFWADEFDWRPKAFLKRHLLIDPAVEADPEKIEVFGLVDQTDGPELYAKIADPEAAREAGWDVGAVKQLLINVYVKGGTNKESQDLQTASPWNELEQRFKSNDPRVQIQSFERIKIVHLLVRESDDMSVTHFILPLEQNLTTGFLRERPKRFPAMERALWLLPYGFEDGEIGSLRGLGHELFTYAEMSNRILCSASDGGVISGGLLLETATGFDTENLTITRMGPVTYLPPNTKAVQSSFQPPIGPLLQLRAILRDIAGNNTGTFRPLPELVGNDAEKTARQVAAEESKEVRYQKHKANFEYLHWEKWHREIFRRVTNPEYIFSEVELPGQLEAARFVFRCVQRGVPLEVMLSPDALYIRVARVIGLGSPGARLDITNQLLSVSPRMDEISRRFAEREWAAARVGYSAAEKFFPMSARDKTPTNDTSIAVLENNDFDSGRSVPVGSDQFHVIHLEQAHFPHFLQLVESLKSGDGGATPEQVYTTLRAGIPHVYRHIQYLAQDPTRQEYLERAGQVLQALMDAYKELEAQLGDNAEAIAQAANAERDSELEEIQRQMSEESQIKLRDIELKYQLEQMKQASLNDARAYKTQVQQSIREWQAQQESNLKRWMAEQQINLQRMVADAKVDEIRRKTDFETTEG